MTLGEDLVGIPTLDGIHGVEVQDDIPASNPARAVRSLTERTTQGRRALDLTAEQRW